jgi:hypothetical protein
MDFGKTVRDLAMFMLYIVILGLIIAHSSDFATVINAVGSNWIRTLRTLQGASGGRRSTTAG